MNTKFLCALFFVNGLTLCVSFKALVLVAGNLRSLSSLFERISLLLVDAGHEVVLVTSYPPSIPCKNLTVLRTKDFSNYFDQANMFELQDSTKLDAFIHSLIKDQSKAVWTNEEFVSLWKTRQTFDLVLQNSYFLEFAFPFLMDSNAQLVQVITPGIEPISLIRGGNWLSPAVVPSLFVSYDDQMSFLQRCLNLPATISQIYSSYTYKTILAAENTKGAPGFIDSPKFYDKLALSLINGHYAFDGPVPLLPNQVEIGSINIRDAKKLPQDLEEFIEEADDAGVIYFSLGGIVKSEDVPLAAKMSFIEAFKKIPQRVIWKYKEPDLELPPNVITRPWLPQQDILRHPKTKAFISHCGNQGTQEAKYFGVPVLGVPIFFDQPRNAIRMERKGLAIILQWEDITSSKIVNALNKLVNDSSYKTKISQVSRILQDQRVSPRERLVWWMEYIVGHKGAPQLQYAGKKLHFLQYIMADVLLFWFIIIAVFVAMLKKIFLFMYGYCFKRKLTSKKLKKQ